jgi:hypothetical protein
MLPFVLLVSAIVWPRAAPREVVVLALIAWAGIFVVAFRATRG